MSDLTLTPGTHPIDVAALPQGWRAMQLKDFCTFVQGGRLGLTKQDHYRSSGIPAFSAAGQDGYVEVTEFRNTDAVVLSAIGANCGRCFSAAGDWTTLANVQVVIPDFTEAHARFLHYRVNRDDYWPRSGSAQPFIKPSDIKSCWVALPPIVEQVAVVQALDTLDTAIHQTEAIIAKLKAVKQGLLHDLLTRGIDANGELRPPQAEAPHLYKESPREWIPREWIPMRVGKVALLQRGHDIVETCFRPGPYPVVSSSGVIGHHAVKTSSGPNVVVGRKGSIGTVHYVASDCWAHDTSLYVANFFGNDEKFVFHLFEHMRLARYGTKSGSPSLNRNDVHPLTVGLPSWDEQKRIADALQSAAERVADEEANLSKLKETKMGLMDDLLTGRVRVTPLLTEAAQQPGSF